MAIRKGGRGPNDKTVPIAPGDDPSASPLKTNDLLTQLNTSIIDNTKKITSSIERIFKKGGQDKIQEELNNALKQIENLKRKEKSSNEIINKTIEKQTSKAPEVPTVKKIEENKTKIKPIEEEPVYKRQIRAPASPPPPPPVDPSQPPTTFGDQTSSESSFLGDVGSSFAGVFGDVAPFIGSIAGGYLGRNQIKSALSDLKSISMGDHIEKLQNIKKTITGADSVNEIEKKMIPEFNAWYLEQVKILKKTEELKENIAQDGGAAAYAAKTIERLASENVVSLDDINSRLYKLFGGHTEFHKQANDNLKSLGMYQDLYGKAISQNIDAIEHFERARQALSLDDKKTEALTRLAVSRGENLFKVFERIRRTTKESADHYGVNLATMRKDTVTLRKDFVHFGHLSDEALANLVGRMHSLGVETDKLSGIMDKFKTFDSAAKVSSELSQAFGMNVDAMKLMKAENPAETIDILREALLNTGKTFDDLSFKQKDYLVSTSGLSQEMFQSIGTFEDVDTTIKSRQQRMLRESATTSKAMRRRIKLMQGETGTVATKMATAKQTSAYNAAEAGMKRNLKRQKKIYKAGINMAKSYEEIFLKMSGTGAAGVKATQDMNEQLERFHGVIVKINKLTANQNVVEMSKNFVEAMSAEAAANDPEFRQKHPDKYRVVKREGQEALGEGAARLAQYQLKLAVESKKLKYRIYGQALSAIIPTIEAVSTDVTNELKTLTDERGVIDLSNIAKKIDLDTMQLSKSWESVKRSGNNLLESSKIALDQLKTVPDFLNSFFKATMIGKGIESAASKSGQPYKIPDYSPIGRKLGEEFNKILESLIKSIKNTSPTPAPPAPPPKKDAAVIASKTSKAVASHELELVEVYTKQLNLKTEDSGTDKKASKDDETVTINDKLPINLVMPITLVTDDGLVLSQTVKEQLLNDIVFSAALLENNNNELKTSLFQQNRTNYEFNRPQ